ncbi:hypothetical protein TanjilG_26516 [Lupinus angustifolius]|uniref:Uncharacterized protein n=1 Tax=Lupinus angustifolius TaxID=3871 RepID=A0A4P1QPL6_LUPAN|nr:hypothetical protein TanjilG_26516 [Lupinus angustifolius]
MNSILSINSNFGPTIFVKPDGDERCKGWSMNIGELSGDGASCSDPPGYVDYAGVERYGVVDVQNFVREANNTHGSSGERGLNQVHNGLQ